MILHQKLKETMHTVFPRCTGCQFIF